MFDPAKRRAELDRLAAIDLKQTTVVIALGDKCQEVVSSWGGRVAISGKTLKQLERLFGIEL